MTVNWRWTLVVAAAFIALGVLLTAADAHSFYSAHCCNDTDCRPVVSGEVEWTEQGWLVKPLPDAGLVRAGHKAVTVPRPTLVPFDHFSIKPSEDVEMHVCIVGNIVRCLYIPDPGI